MLGSVRRECLDHTLVVGERHLHRVLAEYVRYYNGQRPHQRIGQRIAAGTTEPPNTDGRVVAEPVLGGLLTCTDARLEAADTGGRRR